MDFRGKTVSDTGHEAMCWVLNWAQVPVFLVSFILLLGLLLWAFERFSPWSIAELKTWIIPLVVAGAVGFSLYHRISVACTIPTSEDMDGKMIFK